MSKAQSKTGNKFQTYELNMKRNWTLNVRQCGNTYNTSKLTILNQPDMSNHKNRAATGHNSLFKGLAQRDSVTPEKKFKKGITLHEYLKTW